MDAFLRAREDLRKGNPKRFAKFQRFMKAEEKRLRKKYGIA